MEVNPVAPFTTTACATNAGKKGHYAKSCPVPQAPRQAGQQGRPAQSRAPRQGKVNHVTAESAVESPNVVIGTSMVNSYPATVLFDTGATHSFIAQSFVEHHGIRANTLKKCMLVSSPGGLLGVHLPVDVPVAPCSASDESYRLCITLPLILYQTFVINVINNIRTRFIISFYMICAVIYCSFCCIYV